LKAPSAVADLHNAAERFAHRCAIEDAAQQITFAELLTCARSIAADLSANGLRRGDRVALILPNSIEFAAAYYGAMMAGGIAVLLNAAAKVRDLEAWLRHCEPAIVCVEAHNSEAASAIGGLAHQPRVLHPSGDWKRPFGLDASSPTLSHAFAVATGPDDPACILYTSGTTGDPKGVVLSHANIGSNTAAIVQYLRLSHGDSVVSVLPFYYSYGSSLLHSHIKAGACVVLQQNLVYPHAVVEMLASRRATGFSGVPSTFALLLARVKLQDYDLSALRYLTQAGGAMSPALTQRLREALPHARLFVMYGQTEATARLAYLSPERLDDKLGSVGMPVRDVEIEVRDTNGKRVAPGQVGEVWARGPNVMLGYWRNPAATAQVKVDGWLRTGDMGHLDAEGFLYLAGRRADMIKVGAHRIHPQDIEDAICELSCVQEAAVVGIDDELLGQVIKAFVVPAAGATLQARQIQAHCRDRLPSYKVPKLVQILASLPKTATGKVRRIELIEGTKP
jgi:long-chain acyl-CoA synthetase